MRGTFEEYEALPTHEYAVELKSAAVESNQYGEQLKWQIAIADGEFEGRKLLFWTPTDAFVGNKLSKLFEACGVQVGKGLSFDTDDLIGKKCLATVVKKRKKDDSGFTNSIEEMNPVKRTASAAKSAEKQQWACPGCGGKRMLTTKQIEELVNVKYGGVCADCHAKGKAVLPAEDEGDELEDPFAEE